MEVNGKFYSMWGQIIEKKAKWVGGVLFDEEAQMETEIVDIELRPNGADSAFFEIKGKTFNCGFDVQYGGISGRALIPGWFCFSGYGGHNFRIKDKV